MKEFVKFNVTLNYDEEETKEVFVNPKFICLIEKNEEHSVYLIKMTNNDIFYTKELPNEITKILL